MRGEGRAGGGRGDAEGDLGGRGASLDGHRDVGATGGRRRVGRDEPHLGGAAARQDGEAANDPAAASNSPRNHEHHIKSSGPTSPCSPTPWCSTSVRCTARRIVVPHWSRFPRAIPPEPFGG